MSQPQVVLITGSAAGIGRATALLLASKGYHVIASARRPESVRELEELGKVEGWQLESVQLDVTDSASIKSAMATIHERVGRLDVLVNNAGYGQYGPSEIIPIADVRRQFETNVFGLLELTQQVIPIMRAQGKGRIINVSSLGGRITMLFAGVYCASKFALEALSDALRMELGVFGIDVIVVQPGPTSSNFSQTVLDATEELRKDPDSPYAPFMPLVNEAVEQFTSQEVPSEDVARVIWRAIYAARPKTRYQVGMTMQAAEFLRRILPDRLIDRQMKGIFKYSEAPLRQGKL